MNIRKKGKDESAEAHRRLEFCLGKFEAAKKFSRGIGWGTEIVKDCTVEELVGAIVSASDLIKKLEIALEEYRSQEEDRTNDMELPF